MCYSNALIAYAMSHGGLATLGQRFAGCISKGTTSIGMFYSLSATGAVSREADFAIFGTR